MNNVRDRSQTARRRATRKRGRRLVWGGLLVLLLVAGGAVAARPWGLVRNGSSPDMLDCPSRPQHGESPDDAESPPSTYDAICHRSVLRYPALPPLGAAGHRFTDPTFGSRMVRVTDAKTRPDQVGRFWASPSSAETSAWNTRSTKFYVTGGGAETVPYNFDPATLTPSRMGARGGRSGGLVLYFSGEPSFSLVDPDLLYGAERNDPNRIVSYRFSTGTQTVLHDVRTCLRGVAVHGGSISVTRDDERFLEFVGGSAQDLDTYVYVYDRTLGCRWLNTMTGEVGGAWGPTGRYRGDAGWRIHNARISKSGKWARITASSASAAGVYFWNVDSLTLLACHVSVAPNYCGGHQVTGFEHVINQRQLGDGMDFAIRPMNAPATATALIVPRLAPAQWGIDTHPSWNNVRANEKQPVCMATFRTDDRVDRAWDGEIICVETDGLASTVWRFAHHRSRIVSFWDQPRANVSQDGRFVLFTSNWDGTVGSGRQDAFIVQLAPHRPS